MPYVDFLDLDWLPVLSEKHVCFFQHLEAQCEVDWAAFRWDPGDPFTRPALEVSTKMNSFYGSPCAPPAPRTFCPKQRLLSTMLRWESLQLAQVILADTMKRNLQFSEARVTDCSTLADMWRVGAHRSVGSSDTVRKCAAWSVTSSDSSGHDMWSRREGHSSEAQGWDFSHFPIEGLASSHTEPGISDAHQSWGEHSWVRDSCTQSAKCTHTCVHTWVLPHIVYVYMHMYMNT